MLIKFVHYKLYIRNKICSMYYVKNFAPERCNKLTNLKKVEKLECDFRDLSEQEE